MSTEKSEVTKRRGTSLILIIGFLILGAVGYVFGEKIMTYAFYIQEMFIASSGTKGGDIPTKIVPDTSGDPNVGPGPGVEGPGFGAPGSSAPSTGESKSDAPKADDAKPTEPSVETPAASASTEPPKP